MLILIYDVCVTSKHMGSCIESSLFHFVRYYALASVDKCCPENMKWTHKKIIIYCFPLKNSRAGQQHYMVQFSLMAL